ncbi:uncharacterized protein LOC135843362 [Planococcus citri]|uniref:uncharacterized protein LOC135843362 n=1 Tax=Planococcus citri TaxID=170843 RepID=UPI0031F9366C
MLTLTTNFDKSQTLRTNHKIIKIILIISTAIFVLIDETSTFPSKRTQSHINGYNIVEFEEDTQVCEINLKHPTTDSKISKSDDFRDFVSNSKLWVDKSLLAEKIVTAADRVILITAPRKWGKSLNLNMLKCIFENSPTNVSTEADFVHKFFTKQIVHYENITAGKVMCRPLISTRTDFMKKYFQKYPVVYLNFRNFTLDNWRSSFKISISRVYKKHEYLHTHWKSVASDQNKPFDVRKNAKKITDKFSKYMRSKDDDDSSLQNSIAWLCQNLYEVYDKKCFVFIDEFDALQNETIFKNETGTEAIEFMKTFNSLIFKNPEKAGIERAVLTGILRSAKSTLLSDVPRYYDANSINMKRFTPFYGFTPHEVEAIIRHEEPESFQEYFRYATKWYDGYGSLGLWDGSMFNAWDITRHIETFTTHPFWVKTGSMEVLMKLLSFDFFEKIICAALDSNQGYQISASSLQNVDESTLEEIRGLLNAEYANMYQYEKNNGRDEQLQIAAIQFALQTGYLSVRSNLGSESLKKINSGSMKVPIIVPNWVLRLVLRHTRDDTIRLRYIR